MSNTTDAMRAALETTDEQLEQLVGQIDELTKKVEALRKIKAGIEEFLGGGEDENAQPRDVQTRARGPQVGPRGREAAARVLQERPNMPLSVQQVADAVVAKGWISPKSSPIDSVRTALLRAEKHFREVVRVGTGTYMWREDAGYRSGGSDYPESPSAGQLGSAGTGADSNADSRSDREDAWQKRNEVF